MSITFKCGCGKRYQVRDEFAGRRSKCQSCGATLVVPKPQESGVAAQLDDLSANDFGFPEDRPVPTPSPRIKVSCQCGQQLSAKANLAGKTAKCPKCGSAVRIPSSQALPSADRLADSPASLGDLLDEAGAIAVETVPCRGCGSPMSRLAATCDQCGWQRRPARTPTAKSRPARPRTSLGSLRLAVDSRKWIPYAAGLGVLGLLGIAWLVSAPLAGLGLTLVGSGLCIAGGIWLLVIAFQDENYHGVLCLLCGPYLLLYVVMHLDTCTRPFLTQLGGLVLIYVGAAMEGANPMPPSTRLLMESSSHIPVRHDGDLRDHDLEKNISQDPHGASKIVDVNADGKLQLEGYVWITPGEFMMGSPEDDPYRDAFQHETQHQVILTEGIYLGKYEVTQAQHEEVMGENPSYFKGAGPNAPVERVTWHEAMEFWDWGRTGVNS